MLSKIIHRDSFENELWNNKDLEIACKRYIGKTRSCIEKVKDLPNWNDLKNKYAAGVTHLMLYPADGVIKYLNYDKVKIK